MDKTVVRLTVLFEPPFWIGLWEREWRGGYQVCKTTFGAEPKDYDIYDFTLKNYAKLRFQSSSPERGIVECCKNPKRLQREIRKQIDHSGMGTKAQQALKLQQEESKAARQKHHRKKCEAEQERRFLIRQKKHKEKHRGH